jgi:methionyl-tRNA synthetase
MNITINDFKKIEIKIGRITKAENHPNADNLLVFAVDVGNEQKQIVAGIKKFYTPEQVFGKLIVVITNLEPVVLRGVESQGMLLSASDSNTLAILTVDHPVNPGSIVK